MAIRDLSSAQLVKEISNDNIKAFEELYSRNWKSLYLYAEKKLKSEDEAKDIVQEVFIKFWNKRKNIVIHDSPEAYLYSIAKYDILGKIASDLRIEEKKHYYSEHILPQFTELFDPIQLEELSLAIDQAIHRLPQRLQEIYRLNKQEDLSIKEIAIQLNISEQTVKNQLGTALKRLRLTLKEAVMVILISQIHRF